MYQAENGTNARTLHAECLLLSKVLEVQLAKLEPDNKQDVDELAGNVRWDAYIVQVLHHYWHMLACQ